MGMEVAWIGVGVVKWDERRPRKVREERGSSVKVVIGVEGFCRALAMSRIEEREKMKENSKVFDDQLNIDTNNNNECDENGSDIDSQTLRYPSATCPTLRPDPFS
jgi:hypothetical protein